MLFRHTLLIADAAAADFRHATPTRMPPLMPLFDTLLMLSRHWLLLFAADDAAALLRFFAAFFDDLR